MLVHSLGNRSKYQAVDPTSPLLAYVDDPLGFVLSFIPSVSPADYQREILENVVPKVRVSVRGPHGLGKSTFMSWLLLWYALTREAMGVDWKVLTLASAWRQLEKFLWPEVHKWARLLNWSALGRTPFTESELHKLSLSLGHGEAFAISSDVPEAIEGAHADYIFYIFDESKIIPDKTWDSAEGAFASGTETFWVSASTPGDLSGRFYQIQTHSRGYQDWWVRHVTKDEAIRAGRMSSGWAENRKRQWGERSSAYITRVLGEFSEGSDDSIIPYGWIEKAIERWYQLHDENDPTKWIVTLPHLSALACDVGRGGDPSTIVRRYSSIVGPIIRKDVRDTMEVTGEVVARLKEEHSFGPVIVDVIGLGAGVVDRLGELEPYPNQRYQVIPFNAHEKTDLVDRFGAYGFVDQRSAGWWHLREVLDPDQNSDVALPPDEEDLLIGDLTAPHWKVLSGGLIKVESKEELRKRLGRSTDFGDVVMMVFWDSTSSEGVSWEDLKDLGRVEDYQSPWGQQGREEVSSSMFD